MGKSKKTPAFSKLEVYLICSSTRRKNPGMRKIRGSAFLRGQAKKPSNEIKGRGEIFNGDFFITKLEHLKMRHLGKKLSNEEEEKNVIK